MIPSILLPLADFTDGSASWPMAACYLACAIGAVGVVWVCMWYVSR